MEKEKYNIRIKEKEMESIFMNMVNKKNIIRKEILCMDLISLTMNKKEMETYLL